MNIFLKSGSTHAPVVSHVIPNKSRLIVIFQVAPMELKLGENNMNNAH